LHTVKDASVRVVLGVIMPRAVIISVGNLSLTSIKELVSEHAIANATVNIESESTAISLSELFEQQGRDSRSADCIFVKAPFSTIAALQFPENVQVFIAYSSPELYLHQALLKANDVNKTDAVALWQQDVKNVVQFSKQNQNIKIVSVDDILANPSSFIEQVFDKKIETKPDAQTISIHQQLMLLASASFLIDQDELYELYDDALSASIMFSEFSVHLSPDTDFFKQKSNALQYCASVFLSTLTELDTAKDTLANKSSEILALNESVAKLNKQLEISREDIVKKATALENVAIQKNKSDENNKELENELAKAEEALSKKQRSLDSAKTEMATLKDELKLLNVHIAQLQEEHEAAIVKAEKLEDTEKTLNITNAALSEANKKLGKAEEEGQLALLQISQLQEELEAAVVKARKFEETSKTLNATKVALAEASAKQVEEDSRLFALQMTQLQEELETRFSEVKKLKEEKHQLHQAVVQLREAQKHQNITDNDNAKRAQNAELELELASLQITQLQEELEHYYLSLPDSAQATSKGIENTAMTASKIQSKVFDKVFSEKLSVTGQYEAADYRDVHINLDNVVFPSGVQLDNLQTKLMVVSGHIGIEFRVKDAEKPLFRVREDATDEYGPYLRYFLTTPSNLSEQQQKMVELSASERLLIFGTINVIAERMQDSYIETTTNLTSEAWRTWRKASTEFAEHVDNLPDWLSFDELKLREEYITDGYEHLWLTFRNLLLGNVWREKLELKLTANSVGYAANGEFSDKLSIEFRELDDGSAPLLTWPPEESDEYGPVFNIMLDDKDILVELVQQDRALISHLVRNLPSILEKLNAKDKVLQRSTNEWKDAISAILLKESETSAITTQEDTHLTSLEDYPESLSCYETISEGNYQHIVFVHKRDNTKIKLRAENINPETFDAEVYLEFRDGTSNVIYHDSEFYGEDSFGPFVKIPVEFLIGNTSQIKQKFAAAARFYESALDLINTSENVDELVKSLWVNIITQKEILSNM